MPDGKATPTSPEGSPSPSRAPATAISALIATADHSRLTRRALLLGAAALTGQTVLPACASAGRIQVAPHATVVPLFKRCHFGAYAENAPYPDLGPHYGLESIVGAHLGRMSWFQDMGVPWLTKEAADAALSGHEIMIAWQPSADGKPIKFGEILEGHWDENLTAFFRAAARHPRTVIIRPFWEMNSSAPAYSLNYPKIDRQVDSLAQFIETWRYIVNVQRSVGPGIKWFFCANGTDTGQNRAEQYWPGTDFVDEIGFDIYNDDRSPWASFNDRAKPMYDRLVRLAPDLPVSIGEIGCRETGAPEGESKSSWTQQMFLSESFPNLTNVCFFNAHKDGQPDWRLYSSADTLRTYRFFLSRAP